MKSRGIKHAVISTQKYLKRRFRDVIYNVIRSNSVIAGPKGHKTSLHPIYTYIYKMILERKIGSGIDVMEKDWDNLILLDAYRADYFQEYSSFEGKYSTVVSKGNWSLEFIVNNFKGEQYHDTVVVTSNPWYWRRSKLDGDTFHALINSVDIHDPTFMSPSKTTRAAVEAAKQYPNKRVLVHYMSPHTPHLGSTSDSFRESFGEEQFPGMFNLYYRNMISQDVLKNSYIDSIRSVESEAQKLAAELDGKTVISSDHGENLGEVQHGIMQLEHGNATPECRYVPWLVIESNNRKLVLQDSPDRFDKPSQQELSDRLTALGYK